MTKADELWEKHSSIDAGWITIKHMGKSEFLAALAEYGQAVRAQDAGRAREMYPDPTYFTGYAAKEIAAAIEATPLP